jgi:hypothetical protein
MAKQIVIGIPGMWKSEEEITLSLAREGYVYVGGNLPINLVKTETDEKYRLEIRNHDPSFKHAFELAAQSRVSAQEVNSIDRHTLVLYLVCDTQSVNSARLTMNAVSVLIQLGGIGVKVESAGIAHSTEDWLGLAQSNEPFDVYLAYVTLINGDDVYYSCGMHNFGLPDVSMVKAENPENAAYVMNTFNGYCIFEAPQLNDGHTFSISANSAKYRLKKMPYFDTYDKNSVLFNPYGRWHLTK